MNANEVLKVTLLSHSQNMLIAAEQKDWDSLVYLEKRWAGMVDANLHLFKTDLSLILPQLLLDSDQLQALVLTEQKATLTARQGSLQSYSHVKNYLK